MIMKQESEFGRPSPLPGAAMPPFNRVSHRFVCLAALLVANGCVESLVQPAPEIALVDSIPSTTLHAFPQPALNVCIALGWQETCDDPMYSDDQRFRLSDAQFGPHVFIAPAPALRDYTTESAFQNITLVGMAYVTPDPAFPSVPSPSSYSELKLSYGASCLYLHRPSGTTGFVGYVVPYSDGCATNYTGSAATRVNVATRAIAEAFRAGSETDVAGRIAPVARFHEVIGHVTEPTTVIGIRCGSRWCLLSGIETPFALRGAPMLNEPESLTRSVFGWSDGQRLALHDPAGRISPTGLSATIYASDNLSANTWLLPAGLTPGVSQHAATIVFDQTPRGKYSSRWKFRQGRNELYVWKNPAGQWRGEIRNSVWRWHWLWFRRTDYRTAVFVQQRHVGMNPPASARFRWNEDDEEIWVYCDAGCCYVTAFQ